MAKARKGKSEEQKGDNSEAVVRHQKLCLSIDMDKRRIYGYMFKSLVQLHTLPSKFTGIFHFVETYYVRTVLHPTQNFKKLWIRQSWLFSGADSF